MTGRLRLLAALASILLAGPVHAADPIQDGQWYTQVLQLDQAHRITRGAGVIVAVIDTGVDGGHPDLAGTVLPGIDLSAGVPSGDGHTDTDGHGTAMASLITGHGRIRGIAPEAKVLPIRSTTGDIGVVDTPGAIQWAVQHGASVISISTGTRVSDLAEQMIVRAALAKDVVIVAAAGNAPAEDRVGYPAAYPGVVAVGGVDKAGSHCAASVTGPEIVIAAPCDGISSAHLKRSRVVSNGTSNSAAIVAGVVALLRARYPDLSAPDIVHRLTATATDRGPPGRDDNYGFGVIDPVAALTAQVEALPSATPAPSSMPQPVAAPGSRFPAGTAVVIVCAALAVALAVAGAFVFLRRIRLPRNERQAKSRTRGAR